MLAEAFEQVRFVSGVAVLTQGEADRDVYVLLSGQVRLVRNDLELNPLLADRTADWSGATPRGFPSGGAGGATHEGIAAGQHRAP